MTIHNMLILFFLLSCQSASEAEIQVLADRAEKNTMFKTGQQSPLDSLAKANFDGLIYYDYDDDFRVEATFVAVDTIQLMRLPTTKGLFKTYQYIGDLKFVLKGTTQSLRLLKTKFFGKDYYFLPFKDQTTSTETYYTGRYMEPEFTEGKPITLDFNTAYNPWCNYSDTYNCPIPVRFNEITIKVEAGEKTWKRPL